MAIKYFVKAAVSEFKGDDGNMKKRYQSIGVIMETKHGLMLKLESLPLFAMKEGGLLAYLNEPEEKAPNSNQNVTAVGLGGSSGNLANLEEDIPF